MKNWLPGVLKIIKGDLEGKAELSHITESFRQYLRKKINIGIRSLCLRALSRKNKKRLFKKSLI